MTTIPSARSLDSGTRLAVDRTRLAYERTLMAWIRTAASLISFGFTIYKFFEFESGRGSVPPASVHLLTPRQFGMTMIATGIFALAFAAFDHRRNLARLGAEFGPFERSVSLAVAALVSGMGILALVVTFVRG
jgi:putative membrane protein